MTDENGRIRTSDAVLEEIWRVKDEISAVHGYDGKRLLADIRKREKRSGHPLVEPPKRLKGTVAS